MKRSLPCWPLLPILSSFLDRLGQLRVILQKFCFGKVKELFSTIYYHAAILQFLQKNIQGA